MTRWRDTGDGEDYSAAEAEAVADALMDAYYSWDEGGGPTPGEPSRINVTARVEWAGTYHSRNNGRREVRLDQLKPEEMRKVRAAVDRLTAAQGRAITARPASSYTAKGWHAQFNQLFRTAKGYAAMDRAGVSASRATLGRWLRGEQIPNKANREAIARAYEAARNDRVTSARQGVERARAEAAEALTSALDERYGSKVRFRDIERFDFQ